MQCPICGEYGGHKLGCDYVEVYQEDSEDTDPFVGNTTDYVRRVYDVFESGFGYGGGGDILDDSGWNT